MSRFAAYLSQVLAHGDGKSVTGIMRASTYVLISVAPVNLGLNILFVHHTSLGLLGSPAAISITYWICFLGLTLFTYLSPTHRKNKTWTRIRLTTVLDPSSCILFLELAIPGILMVGTEWYAVPSSRLTSEGLKYRQGCFRGRRSRCRPPGTSVPCSTVRHHDHRPKYVLSPTRSASLAHGNNCSPEHNSLRDWYVASPCSLLTNLSMPLQASRHPIGWATSSVHAPL